MEELRKRLAVIEEKLYVLFSQFPLTASSNAYTHTNIDKDQEKAWRTLRWHELSEVTAVRPADPTSTPYV